MKSAKLNQLFFILILTVYLAGCAPQANHEGNIALIESYIDAVEGRDSDIMTDLLSDDYMGYGPSHNDSINKEGAVEMWKVNSAELYESITYKKSRNIAVTIPDGENAGEWVSNWAMLEIAFQDGSGPVETWANTTYQIRDGKITKSFTFYNEADVLEQLGYVFVDVDDLYAE